MRDAESNESMNDGRNKNGMICFYDCRLPWKKLPLNYNAVAANQSNNEQFRLVPRVTKPRCHRSLCDY